MSLSLSDGYFFLLSPWLCSGLCLLLAIAQPLICPACPVTVNCVALGSAQPTICVLSTHKTWSGGTQGPPEPGNHGSEEDTSQQTAAFSLCPHRTDRVSSCHFLIIRTLIPLWGPALRTSNHLPKPHLLTQSHQGSELQNMNLGDMDTNSMMSKIHIKSINKAQQPPLTP